MEWNKSVWESSFAIPLLYALIVDAKDDAAKAFYEHYGFVPCVDQPRTLYLPLGK